MACWPTRLKCCLITWSKISSAKLSAGSIPRRSGLCRHLYGRPVTPAAVDYLLQPFLAVVNSAPILGRLVNMQFARKETGRYYLHPVDLAYALSGIERGNEFDHRFDALPFTQFALLHRAADYFQRAGVGADTLIIPRQRLEDREWRANRPGFEVVRQPNDLSEGGLRRFHGRGLRRSRAEAGTLILAHNLLFIQAQRRHAHARNAEAKTPQTPCAA